MLCLYYKYSFSYVTKICEAHTSEYLLDCSLLYSTLPCASTAEADPCRWKGSNPQALLHSNFLLGLTAVGPGRTLEGERKMKSGCSSPGSLLTERLWLGSSLTEVRTPERATPLLNSLSQSDISLPLPAPQP